MIKTLDDESYARAALTYLAEPADHVLGAVLRVHGAARTLEAIKAGTGADPVGPANCRVSERPMLLLSDTSGTGAAAPSGPGGWRTRSLLARRRLPARRGAVPCAAELAGRGLPVAIMIQQRVGGELRVWRLHLEWRGVSGKDIEPVNPVLAVPNGGRVAFSHVLARTGHVEGPAAIVMKGPAVRAEDVGKPVGALVEVVAGPPARLARGFRSWCPAGRRPGRCGGDVERIEPRLREDREVGDLRNRSRSPSVGSACIRVDRGRAYDVAVVPLDDLSGADPVAAFGQFPGRLPILVNAEQPDAGDAVVAR